MFSVPSFHEDTTVVQDINYVTLTTPTEQDKETIFETHQNG